MTFEELLEYNATQLESLTDEQLLTYLAPCLKDCPPIDIQVYEQEQAKIKQAKQEQKLAKKLADNPESKLPGEKKNKKKSKVDELKEMQALVGGLSSMLEKMK